LEERTHEAQRDPTKGFGKDSPILVPERSFPHAPVSPVDARLLLVLVRIAKGLSW